MRIIRTLCLVPVLALLHCKPPPPSLACGEGTTVKDGVCERDPFPLTPKCLDRLAAMTKDDAVECGVPLSAPLQVINDSVPLALLSGGTVTIGDVTIPLDFDAGQASAPVALPAFETITISVQLPNGPVLVVQSAVSSLAGAGGGAAAASYAATGRSTDALQPGGALFSARYFLLLDTNHAEDPSAPTLGDFDVTLVQVPDITGACDSTAAPGCLFSSVSNVLKTKHDTAKNSIGNIRREIPSGATTIGKSAFGEASAPFHLTDADDLSVAFVDPTRSAAAEPSFASKVVEKATSGLKDTLKTQVRQERGLETLVRTLVFSGTADRLRGYACPAAGGRCAALTLGSRFSVIALARATRQPDADPLPLALSLCSPAGSAICVSKEESLAHSSQSAAHFVPDGASLLVSPPEPNRAVHVFSSGQATTLALVESSDAGEPLATASVGLSPSELGDPQVGRPGSLVVILARGATPALSSSLSVTTPAAGTPFGAERVEANAYSPRALQRAAVLTLAPLASMAELGTFSTFLRIADERFELQVDESGTPSRLDLSPAYVEPMIVLLSGSDVPSPGKPWTASVMPLNRKTQSVQPAHASTH